MFKFFLATIILLIAGPDLTLVVNKWYYLINFQHRMEVIILNIVGLIFLVVLKVSFLISSFRENYHETLINKHYSRLQFPLILINFGLSFYVDLILIKSQGLMEKSTVTFIFFLSTSMNCYEIVMIIGKCRRERQVQPLTQPIFQPISPQQIALKEITYDEPQNCCICLENFTQGNILSCKHSFHKKCIETWLQSKPNCPLCRIDLV